MDRVDIRHNDVTKCFKSSPSSSDWNTRPQREYNFHPPTHPATKIDVRGKGFVRGLAPSVLGERAVQQSKCTYHCPGDGTREPRQPTASVEQGTRNLPLPNSVVELQLNRAQRPKTKPGTDQNQYPRLSICIQIISQIVIHY